jgi:hypothetical protein
MNVSSSRRSLKKLESLAKDEYRINATAILLFILHKVLRLTKRANSSNVHYHTSLHAPISSVAGISTFSWLFNDAVGVG